MCREASEREDTLSRPSSVSRCRLLLVLLDYRASALAIGDPAEATPEPGAWRMSFGKLWICSLGKLKGEGTASDFPSVEKFGTLRDDVFEDHHIMHCIQDVPDFLWRWIG